jgi:hypothetical protein
VDLTIAQSTVCSVHHHRSCPENAKDVITDYKLTDEQNGQGFISVLYKVGKDQ